MSKSRPLFGYGGLYWLVGSLAAWAMLAAPGQCQQSASVQELLRQALKHHPSVNIAKARLSDHAQIVNEARSRFLPNITISGSAGYSMRSVALRGREAEQHNRIPHGINLIANQKIFENRGMFNSIAKGKLQYKGAEINYHHTTTNIQHQILQSIINYIYAKRQLEATVETLEALTKMTSSIKLQRVFGNTSDIDLARIQSETAKIQSRISEFTAKKNFAVSKLRKYTNMQINDIITPTITIDLLQYTMDEIKYIARKNNYTMLYHSNREQIAKMELRQLYRSFLPNINMRITAQTNYQVGPTTDVDNRIEALLVFELPLFAGGANSIRKNRARAEIEAAGYEYQLQAMNSDLMIEELRETLKATRRSNLFLRTALITAQKALDGVVQSENLGLLSTLEVLNAVRTQYDSTMALITNDLNELQTSLTLLLVIDRLDEGLG